MKLVPTPGRVLIKPEQIGERTASGLHVVKHWEPEQRGEVVAVTPGSHPSEVKPGDDVLFSWQAGQEIWIGEAAERLLILREEDVIAVVEP